MSERGAVDAYMWMLEGVANRANEIGPRLIASHWPFVGSDYRGLLVVGQALAGWDDQTPALWTPEAVTNEHGREAILDGTQAWARSRPEPMTVPLRTRGHSPFWSLSRRTVQLLEPNGPSEWYSRYAWWNLFPLGWGDSNSSPWFDLLWDAQFPHLRELFWEVVAWLEPTRIVILAGKGFWWQTARQLGLDALARLPRPLVAAGVLEGRAIVLDVSPRRSLEGRLTAVLRGGDRRCPSRDRGSFRTGFQTDASWLNPAMPSG